MLNTREREIFEIIRKQNSIKTCELEQHLNLSTRSIRYALKTLREKIKIYDIEVYYNSKDGYFLSEMDELTYQKVISKPSNVKKYPKTQQERFVYLLGKLMIYDHIDKDMVENEIYISKSTISNDYKSLVEILQQNFDHNLSTNSLDFIKKLQIFNSIAQQENYMSEKIENKNLEFLFGNEYDLAMLNTIFNQVQALEPNASNYKKFQTTWFLYFISVIKGKSQEQHIPPYVSLGIVNQKVFELLPREITLTAEEINMIDKTLISIGWLDVTNLDFLRIKKIASRYITKLIQELELNINVDSKEINNFCIHLVSLMQRVHDETSITGFEYKDILVRYPFSYYLAKQFCIELFNGNYDRLTPGEVAMIAIYLESILFSSPKVLKTLLVCGSGFGMTNMLYKWVDKYFHTRLEVIDYCSITNVREYLEQSEVDLILSTVSLPADLTCKNIQINNLPTIDDIRNVEELINSYRVNVNYLNTIVTDKFINIYENQVSFEEIITECCHKLEDENIIKDAQLFSSNLLEREKLHSTYFGNGIMAPHTMKIYSEETRIFVNVLKKPVNVNGNSIDVILILVLSEHVEKNIASIYEVIVQLVRNTDLKKKLIDSQTPFDIVIHLSKIINNI